MIPAHTHTVSGSWATALSKQCCAACTSGGTASMLCAGTDVTTSTIYPANTGGGLAHANLPPFAAVYKLIKVKKAA
jgi:microcystin-dependent protein